ncbi:MAG: S41 family peptidase [Verrucomicrobiia bacterium]
MTRRLLKLFTLVLTGGLALRSAAYSGPTNPAPDFKEVYELLRANLPEATDGTLNRAAVAGLVSQFPGKVALVGGPTEGSAGSQNGSALSKAAVIENNVVYFRVSRITGSLPGELGAASRALTSTNPVVGAVLDLRFAGGDDYAAAEKTAGLWTASKASRPVGGPLVVLVNGGTIGAAEAILAELRKAGAALIIGSPTAGAAMTFKEFALKDGERLLIATTPVKVDGQAMPSGGLKPDIAVTVNPEQEYAFWENPYGTLAQNTNAAPAVSNRFLPFIDHTSEADLVRQKQNDGKSLNVPPPGPQDGSVRGKSDDSDSDDDSAPTPAARPPQPVLRDPVLARGVDLVKGLAVVRASHP